MTRLAAMPLFPAEFFADTAHLSTDAAKAYLFLLAHAWLRGARLPAKDDELARMAGVSKRRWQQMRDDVMTFWHLDAEGFYRQKRLQKEFDYVSHRAEVNRNNGARGGRPKDSENKDIENPPGLRNGTGKNPPTPTPTKVSKKKPIDGLEDAFSRFWAVYPRREGGNPRKPAFDKFAVLVRQGIDPEAITAGAKAYAYQCQANGKIGTTFVAQAVTWLNQERWRDEYDDVNGNASGCLTPEQQELLAKHTPSPDELARIRKQQEAEWQRNQS